MNLNKFFYTLLGVSMLMGACTSEEVDPVNVSASAPGVHVRLTGAASPKNHTRATVEAQDGEKTVNSLLAVLFDTHEGFYKTVPASRVGDTDEYTFIVEKDATYDIWLVANASDELRNALESIPEGTKMEDENGVNCLESIIANQPCDADGNFLMVSKYSEKVTTCITETQSIGQVHMIRLSARFDLLNKAEDITVTNINFSNRAIKSALLTPNTMSTTADFYENHDYEVNVKGEPEKGNPWEGYIYSYENHSLSTDVMTPKLTISYYEGTNSSDIKTHEISLIDPNSTAGTTMPIKRNNLYRIVLTKATKLNFDLQVLDWDDEEATFEHPNLSLNLPKNVQDSLNRQLLVYDLFTEYNVKSIDYDNKTVEFWDHHEFDMDILTKDNYFSYNKLKNNNVLNFVLSNNDELYRLPTAGELNLFSPDRAAINSEIEGIPVLNCNDFQYTDEFQEYVYLKNNNKCIVDATHDITTENEYGFTGITQLKRGKANATLTYNAGMYYTENVEDITKSYPVAPVYGIRFKGTSQCAAYKWENIYVNNNISNRAISAKIKALPKDTDVTVNDIVDNHSFWKEDYIEIIIPLLGSYENSTTKSITFSTSFISSSLYSKNSNYLIRCNLGINLIGCTIASGDVPYTLRLVKVKEPAEGTESAE